MQVIGSSLQNMRFPVRVYLLNKNLVILDILQIQRFLATFSLHLFIVLQLYSF